MNNEKIDTFIRKLKTIGKLEPGEKIIVDEKKITIIDFSTYSYDRVKKQFLFEDRGSTCKKLNELFRDIDELTQTLMNNPPRFYSPDDIKITLKRLDKDLLQSYRGVKNLILTYNDDKSTKSDLETISETINILSIRIKNFLNLPNIETFNNNNNTNHSITDLSHNIPVDSKNLSSNFQLHPRFGSSPSSPYISQSVGFKDTLAETSPIQPSAQPSIQPSASSNQASSNQASSNQASSNQASSNQASSNQASSNQASSNQAEASSNQAKLKDQVESDELSEEKESLDELEGENNIFNFLINDEY